MAREFASTGRAVLIYSTETPELVGLCDRVYSLYQGQIVAELAGDDITETLMMNAALGRTTEVFA